MHYKIHLSRWLYAPGASDIYLGWQSFKQQLEKEMIKNVMFVAILRDCFWTHTSDFLKWNLYCFTIGKGEACIT